MKRVDCEVIIKEVWLDKYTEPINEATILDSPKKDVRVLANGIWEEDNQILKLLVCIPDNNIAKSNDEGNLNSFIAEEYRAIYFFSGNEPAFVIYNEDLQKLDLSLGRNLIDIEFPDEYIGRINLVDTTEDTIFLETFGQNPGKNLYLTGNEDALTSKETYYNYWRLVVTRDTSSTDLPLLDEYGKLITDNYRYRVYSNLRIDSPGLTKNTIPYTRYGLSDDGGIVPILGYADFIEYQVFGNNITEILRGVATIESIPSSEIVYISGHNDIGVAVDEVHNIFSINNYSSMIEYIKNESPDSYGADGIFGLRVSYYDVKQRRSVVIESENQIKLVRRNRSSNWYVLRSTTHYTEETQEFGNVPVFLLPYDTTGTESFTIRTKFLNPITSTSQLTLSFDDPILSDLFNIDLGLFPYVDPSGVYYVDILVTIKAKTINEDTINWAPIINNVSTLIMAKISYEEYYEVFYIVQCPKIVDSIKIVDSQGEKLDRIVLNYGTGSNKTVYIVADEESDDLKGRTAWKVLSSPEGVSFPDRNSGTVSGHIQTSYNPENSLVVKYNSNSLTAQNIIPENDIIIVRLNESGVGLDLNTTSNWRVMVNIAQVHIGLIKLGKPISLVSLPSSSIQIKGIGLYELKIRSNCRFTLSTIDSNYLFREKGSVRSSNQLESPLYDDQRYSSNSMYFEYWVVVKISNSTEAVTLNPIKITAVEGDRSSEKIINVTQNLVSSNIYKLKEDGSAYSSGEWEIFLSRYNISSDTEWTRRSRSVIADYKSDSTYSEGDIVKYYVFNPTANSYNSSITYNNGDIVRYGGHWWSSTKSNNQGNLPQSSSSNWENVTQYFLSKSNGNRRNLDISSWWNSSWWDEIPSVQDFFELDQKITNLEFTNFWDSTIQYEIGTIVRKPFQQYSNSGTYSENSKVRTSSGDCWVAIQNNVTGIEPGNTENWENYWRKAIMIDFSYYIAKRTTMLISGVLEKNINKDLSSTIWWTSVNSSDIIYDNFLGIEKKYRFAVVRENNLPYLYMNLLAYAQGINNHINDLSGLLSEIESFEENGIDNKDILFVLSNPDLYRTNTRVKVISSNWRQEIGSNISLFLQVKRDSSWVAMNTLDSLMMTLGNTYNNSYFSNNSWATLSKDEYIVREKYSNLLPSINTRQVYIVSDYISGTSLQDLAVLSGYTKVNELIPYYNSISELPDLSSLAKITVLSTNNHFIKTYCRVPDGKTIRLVKLDLPLVYTSENVGPKWGGHYSSSSTYQVNEVVYVMSSISGIKLYYSAKSSSSASHNPTTDINNTYWDCLSWKKLTKVVSGQTVDIDTTEEAISKVQELMNLKSTEDINYLGSYTGDSLFSITSNQLGRNPMPGDIIKFGTSYYYCGCIWKLSDENIENQEFSKIDNTVFKLPEVDLGYTNILCNLSNNYVYCRSSFIFNNVAVNKYIFVPRYSNNNTQVRFFSRKTPTELLQTTSGNDNNLSIVSNSNLVLIQSNPEFDENITENDHYTAHTIGLRRWNLEATDNTLDMSTSSLRYDITENI